MSPTPTATRARPSRSCTASIPNVVKADFKRAGFQFVGSSNMLRNPADDHSLLVFDPKIRGKTDRVHLQVQEAALSAGRTSRSRRRAARAASALIRRSAALARRPGRWARSPALRKWRVGVASFIGALWLNALKMTVIPLVVALARGRDRQEQRGRRGGQDRRTIGAVDRDHLHRLGGVRRGDDSALDAAVSAGARDRGGPAVGARRGRARRPRRRFRASPNSSRA